MLNVNSSGWKRYFSAPCALVDNYLKLADGAALKVILYLIASDNQPSDGDIISATGLSREAFEDAVMFWQSLGVISVDGADAYPMGTSSAVLSPSPSPTLPATAEPEPIHNKVVHSRYAPKDIVQMLKTNDALKELFTEAESTLGRILKHADHEVLISLTDYYGFDEPSIVLILGYCAGLDKTSARYYETVAKSLFEKGVTEFHTIERELERMGEQHGFEAEIRRDFGLDTKLTKRQREYLDSWRGMGFDLEMISLARERCVDATNKLSFQYIDRILSSWKEKGIADPSAADSDIKPQKPKEERSFDLDEFDMFTLGTGGDKEKK